jgi:hypothetical protein
MKRLSVVKYNIGRHVDITYSRDTRVLEYIMYAVMAAILRQNSRMDSRPVLGLQINTAALRVDRTRRKIIINYMSTLVMVYRWKGKGKNITKP